MPYSGTDLTFRKGCERKEIKERIRKGRKENRKERRKGTLTSTPKPSKEANYFPRIRPVYILLASKVELTLLCSTGYPYSSIVTMS